MSKRIVQAGLLLLSILGAGGRLAAQESALSNFEVKLRGGFTQGNLYTDLGTQAMMGVALGTSVPLARGRLVLDLGFEYFPGKDFDRMPTSGTFYCNPAAPSTTYNGQPVRIAINSGAYGSADMRKNRFQGFNLRAGYRDRLAASWDWQAGLALDDYTATEEVSGTLYPITNATALTGIANPAAGGKPYYESLSVTNQKTKLGLGAFAGVTTRLTDEIRLEFNVRSVSYTRLTYQPFTYTGQAPATLQTTRRGFTFELSLGMSL
ncbi:hypothetical protein [Mesoterricola silvestris]|uniref:Outer membrane protein beta-barrel domain-containing protein n=1 Tax=Mesoterricola silvestris TaxID=2927979 RepID=A0AA48GUR2_9BACT|nr:hypothetical protein [Mesoterricola silvestris]BDU72166.1 hypothetical protein METEAL_13400 [Mesoterricola silvestris]